MNVLNRMKGEYLHLSEAERKICDYILQNPQAVEKETLSRVAEGAKSSTAAVFRFCKSLGYSGYSEFRYDLIRSLQEREREEPSADTLLSSHVAVFAEAVREMGELEEDGLRQLARWIRSSEIIRVFGIRNSSLPALKFYYDFSLLGKNILPVTDDLTPGLLSGVSQGDIILLFSGSGAVISSSIRDFLDTARERKAKIVLVGGAADCDMCHYATMHIPLPKLSVTKEIGLEQQPLMLMLVDILASYFRELI